jgi:hypothetical protein
VTAWAAQGKFTQEPHTVLFCTVSRPDVDPLRSAVTEGDPAAFLVIGHGHQATGGVVRASQARPPEAAKVETPPAKARGTAKPARAAPRKRTGSKK